MKARIAQDTYTKKYHLQEWTSGVIRGINGPSIPYGGWTDKPEGSIFYDESCARGAFDRWVEESSRGMVVIHEVDTDA